MGQQIKENLDLFNLIKEKGHTIGNHTYSHRNGMILSKKKYLSEIDNCNKYMPENKLFRPPYGKIRPDQIKKIIKNYRIIMWDIMSWDFKKNKSPNVIKKNVLNNISNGSIIVFHNNTKSFNCLSVVLEDIISEMISKGFSFSATW